MINGNVITLAAGEALLAKKRVKLAGVTLVYADDEDRAIGVTEYGVGSGEDVAARLINAGGTFECMAAGAVTAGAAIYPAVDGEVEGAGTLGCGFALAAATADGDIIECLLTS
jgi:hypothetical protein